MVTIRLFGLIAENSGARTFVIEAETVRETLAHLAGMGIDKDMLYGALLFINGKPVTGVTRLRHRLSDGDELAFLPPAGGG